AGDRRVRFRGRSRPPYQSAIRLYAVAAAWWADIDGFLAGQGVDPFQLPSSRFLNFVYSFVVSKITDPEERQTFDEELTKPLPWQSKSAQRILRQQEMRQFEKTRASNRRL